MTRFFTIASFLAVTFSGLFFPFQQAFAAGEDCCVQVEVAKETKNTSCRVSSYCNTTPQRQKIDISFFDRDAYTNPECSYPDSTGRLVQTSIETILAGLTFGASAVTGNFTPTLIYCQAEIVRYERPVACLSSQLCIQQLNRNNDCAGLSVTTCITRPGCFLLGQTCYGRDDLTACQKITSPNLCGPASDGSVAGSRVCRWLAGQNGGRCVQATEAAAAQRVAGTESDILPECAIQGTCRSIRDLENLAFKIVNLLFTIIGSVSFAFFIYGGVVMIVSFGNSDRFGTGRSILIAAIVGIFISFGAYLLIGYIYALLGVPSVFRGGINASF